LQNLVAALFRLEKSQGPGPLHEALSGQIQWLGAPEQAGLRCAFTVWIKRVLLPARLPSVGDLLEINTMLAESVNEWTQDWKRQGILEDEFTLLERLLAKRCGLLSDGLRRALNSDPWFNQCVPLVPVPTVRGRKIPGLLGVRSHG
jgi:hypothetical protein